MLKEDTQTILRKAATLDTELRAFKDNWDFTAKLFKPQLDLEEQNPHAPDSTGFSGLFDTTGVEALDTYSNGLIAEVFPANEKWMVFVPQDDHDIDEDGRKWYNTCSETALTYLARSNFYQSIKPCVTDMGCCGTGSLFVSEGKKKLLKFQYDRAGTFAIEEDCEGDIRTEFRYLKRTATEMAEEFGEDNLGQKAMAALKKEQEGGEKTILEVIHAVFPRDVDEPGLTADKKPFASVYICKEDQHELERGGFDYYPFSSPRAEIWNDYNYGLAPAAKALPAMRELNKLRRDVHEGVSLQVKPPWLVPDGMVDEVSNKPNGVTVFDDETQNLPQQMRLYNDINAGMALMEQIAEQVRGFFHADLFEAIAQKDKQMTAREVASIETAALRKFLPNFNQITTEIAPLFQNVFLILFEAGVFPDPPASVRVRDENGETIPLPKVEFTSRIALAIRMIENSAFDRLLERLSMVLQIYPDAIDIFDLDRSLAEAARNDGISEQSIRTMAKIKEIREQRAQQESQMAQMAMAEQAAGTAKTASEINPENVTELAGMAEQVLGG